MFNMLYVTNMATVLNFRVMSGKNVACWNLY